MQITFGTRKFDTRSRGNEICECKWTGRDTGKYFSSMFNSAVAHGIFKLI